MKCKVCNSQTENFSRAKLSNEFIVDYFRCPNCGFIQTEDPYWLDKVYTSAIADSDLGLIQRNIVLSRVTKAIISTLFDSTGKFLDYGGGYGVFVRLLRDLGYDFYRYDKYCPNLFAQGFDADLERTKKFELITAFELFEHLPNPLEDIQEIFSYSDSILFSTELVPPSIPKPGEWWYYALESGQHISFYTTKSLSLIAKKFGRNYYSNGKTLHLITNKKISPNIFKMVSSYRMARIINLFNRRESLLKCDYNTITEKKNDEESI